MKLVVTLVLTIAAVFASPVQNEVQEISPNFDALRDTIFLVFTRFNPTVAQIVDINDMSTVRNSNYDPTRPTRVIIHGQLSDGQSELNIVLTAAYLASSDVNVIVVDWGAGAQTINYISARNQVANVGGVVANFLDNLHESGLLDFSRLIVASHSLGGHVGGFVGKRVTRGRVHTIIGLNPAGPLFDVNNPSERLDSTDAEYVEVVHTETSTFGIGAPIGHANFYANSGTNQPGCSLSACDHSRSFFLYAESLRSNRLWGRECNNVQEVQRNTCTGNGRSIGDPSSANNNLRGIFRVPTNANSPFGMGPF